MKDIKGRLQEWIDEEIEEGLAERTDRFEGSDWWQVSENEIEVFELSPDVMAKIVPVYQAYEAIAGIGQSDFYGTPFCEEAREALPWITQDTFIELEFQRFAKLFGISNREAHAFYWKHSFWEVRQQGIVIFADEK